MKPKRKRAVSAAAGAPGAGHGDVARLSSQRLPQARTKSFPVAVFRLFSALLRSITRMQPPIPSTCTVCTGVYCMSRATATTHHIIAEKQVTKNRTARVQRALSHTPRSSPISSAQSALRARAIAAQSALAHARQAIGGAVGRVPRRPFLPDHALAVHRASAPSGPPPQDRSQRHRSPVARRVPGPAAMGAVSRFPPATAPALSARRDGPPPRFCTVPVRYEGRALCSGLVLYFLVHQLRGGLKRSRPDHHLEDEAPELNFTPASLSSTVVGVQRQRLPLCFPDLSPDVAYQSFLL